MMLQIKKLLRLALGMLLIATCAYSAAQTTCTGSASTVTITMPSTIAMPRDSGNVGRLLTSWISSPATTNYYTCSFSSPRNHASGMAMTVRPTATSGVTVPTPDGSYNIPVYTTNVNGVGIAISFRTYANGCGWSTARFFSTFGNSCNGPSSQSAGGQAQVALVQIGTISSGTISGGTIGTGRVMATDTPSTGADIYTDHSAGAYINFVTTPTTVTAQTCQVSTPSITVTLTPADGLKASAFTGVGSTSSPVPFTIRLNCSGVSSNVYMTMTDQQNPGNTSDIVKLSSSSTATGLGVQILYNNTPIKLGPDSSMAGNTNQFSVGAASSLSSISFQGRYIQTIAKVTPGTAIGLATFTMSYQ